MDKAKHIVKKVNEIGDKVWFPILIFVIFSISTVVQWGKDTFAGADTRCDFSDILEHIGAYSYGRLADSNYPPVAVMIYRFYNLYFRGKPEEYHVYAYNFVLLMTILFTSIAIYSLIQKFIPSKGKWKVVWAVSIFLTTPILWAYQWLNVIIYAFIFLMVFLIYYKSENKWIRYLAIFSLAISANIKYYPGIFVLLLLKKGKIKEFIIAGVMMATFFFGPIVIENAIISYTDTAQIEINSSDKEVDSLYASIDDNINIVSVYNSADTESLVEETSESSGDESESLFEMVVGQVITVFSEANHMADYMSEQGWSTMTFMDTMDYLLIHVHFMDPSYFGTIKIVLYIVYIISSLVMLFITKREDHKWYLLSLMCIFIPPYSGYYTMCFMLIPFLNLANRENKTVLMKVELLCYASMFIPLYNWGPVMFMTYNRWHVILMFMIVFFDCVYEIYKNIKNKPKKIEQAIA